MKYRPAFGRESDQGVSLTEFRKIFGADPLYSWIGLDSPLMYAAHKAAGGMTSIYRQLGIGCERLLREITKDTLKLTDKQVKWSYDYEKEDGKSGVHTLDVLIDVTQVRDQNAKEQLQSWLRESADFLKIPNDRANALKGVVMEVRQGYKSADSKRQNADLRFGMRAYNEGYLPAIVIVSSQISEPVIRRYRAAQMLVLVGLNGTTVESTFSFFKNVVGYDLAGFFKANSPRLRTQFLHVLEGLLSAG